jgi:hypothetical protein
MQTNHPAPGPIPRDQRLAVLAGWFSWIFFAILCPFLNGCQPSKRYDLIESELRTRERELSDTRSALEQSRNLNRAYAQQATGNSEPAHHSAPVYVPVKEIGLARGTGGVFGEGPTGDDGLMVVVVPRDEDGAAVKIPARVEIAAWEISAAGLKTPIGNWSVPPEKVRPTWRNGFVSTGYFIAVPWQSYPSSEKVRIAVRLTTLDGRAFEADKDINVRLGGGSRISPGSATVPLTPPRQPLFPDPIPPGTEELPPPVGAPARGAKLMPPEK